MVREDVMPPLYACPFCRQLFPRGEGTICPECGIELRPLNELPPSLEAQALQPEPPVPVEHELLPWTYLGRGRGPLLGVAMAGLGAAFAPWLHETAPEMRVLSGVEFARHLPWLWAVPVAWFIMLAVVASRRTVYHMRGSRLAVVLLALMVVMTVLWRIVLTPASSALVPRRFEWGWGLYASGLLGAAAVALGWRFGGSVEDMPTRQPRRGDETLH
jgi:hypothetical protein